MEGTVPASAGKSSKRQGQIKPVAKLRPAGRCIPPVVFAEQPKGVSAGALGEVLVPYPTIECRLPRRNVGALQMPEANRASLRAISSAGSILSGPFVAILRSLQKSRRRRARRIIREHRHLIASEARAKSKFPSRNGGHENVGE
jgi:hypothetical protein